MKKNLMNKLNLKGKEVNKMKKMILLLSALLILMGTVSAYGFSVPIGEWNAHFSDFTATYRDLPGDGVIVLPGGDPTQPPLIGDYIKAVVNLDQVIPKGGGLAVWNASATDQVAGLEYGFQILAISGNPAAGDAKVWVGIPGAVAGNAGDPVSMPGMQSRVDLYERNPFVWNTAAGFAPRTGPLAAGMNPADPWSVGNVAGIDDPASLLIGMDVLQHPDQTFNLLAPGTFTPGVATMVLTINLVTATLSGDLYADVDSGSYAGFIDDQLLGPDLSPAPGLQQIPANFYLKFSGNLNPPLYGWTNRSEDPADFSTTIPEPGTILLLGAGLLGLGYFVRRRSK